MRWILSRMLAFIMRAMSIVLLILQIPLTLAAILQRGLRNLMLEADRFRNEGRQIAADVKASADKQTIEKPFDNGKETVFLLITCGQAVRNFLCTDVFPMLRERYNVVLLSPYAYSDEFRKTYGKDGVHVLPWFEGFRSIFERVFQYYLMRRSKSRTHKSWLENLEARAKRQKDGNYRFLKHRAMRRTSDVIGAVLKRRGMTSLYQAYFFSYLPRSLFSDVFDRYEPAIVISTTAHHAEAWPLTYFGRRRGCVTLANVLSWDNLTTKAAMDTECSHYAVWSEEMKGELAYHFPYVKAKATVTGSPLFDLYYQRPFARGRAEFLSGLGLDPNFPYILYTTNTPAGMPDENEIVRQYWEKLNQTHLAGKIGLLVRLHPKESLHRYKGLQGLENVAVTIAGRPHWGRSDRWLPGEEDMALLLNSMIHAAVSVNVASTMSLESFAVGLPTINVAYKSSNEVKDNGLMWSFDMYHFSEHYHALVDNGAVALARSPEELVTQTIEALEHGAVRKDAMQKTLIQKAGYADGASGRRFVELVDSLVAGGAPSPVLAPARGEPLRMPSTPSRVSEAA